MLKRATLAVFFGLATLTMLAQQQKIGVVMSGGAAKGLAHVGMLKALEENDIPIDYVVGTSMGGIIAGCYAAGMSPEQIEEMVVSDAFLDWVNGRLESGYNYYYNKDDDHPSFLKLNLSLDSTFNLLFNTSLANDLSLNFALAQKMAQPAAIAKNNFDSLFVPLRVVAADIFTQTEVVLKKGELSDALRATQTAPFFYNPIRVDGKYLFDGGVYNNFPIDVAQREFNPDVIIGCNVSSKVYDEYPYGEDEKLISRALLYMLLDKSDPARVPATGVYIQPDLKKYSAFDFAKAKAMIDSGYVQTMRQMKEIKAKVAVRRTCEETAAARNRFNDRTKPLLVDRIRFRNFNSRQQLYLNRFFKSGKRPLYFSDVESGYFRLVSEDYFKNIYPNFNYDTLRKDFDFQLSRRPQNNFQVDFGGVIATRNISNIYLGLNYYYFNSTLTHAQLNFYAGSFYKSIQAKAKIDFPFFEQFYIEPEAIVNSWNYLEGKDIIIKKFSPTLLNRTDRKLGASLGIPLGQKYKFAVSGAYISNHDQYVDSDTFVSTDTLDQLRLTGARAGFLLSTSTLNRKQYASEGTSIQVSGDWFNLDESLVPGTTSVVKAPQEHHRTWMRARLLMEQYFKKGFYSSGYLLDAVFSNQPAFSNYYGTIINAPSFNPLQDSRTFLLQNFRAFNYVAGGWRNVFAIRNNLDFRLEGYVFKPLVAIVNGAGQEAVLNKALTKVYLAGTADLVMHTTVGPVSLSLNYYDDKKNRLGLLLHVGFLLFNKTSLE
jgi:NTE family protein